MVSCASNCRPLRTIKQAISAHTISPFQGRLFHISPYCHCLIRPRFKGARCEMTQIAPSLGSWQTPRSVCDRQPLQTESLLNTTTESSSPLPLLGLHGPGLGPRGSLYSAIPQVSPSLYPSEVPAGRSTVVGKQAAAEATRSCSHIPRVSHVSPVDGALSGCGWNHLLRVWQLQAGKGQGRLPRPVPATQALPEQPEQGNAGREARPAGRGKEAGWSPSTRTGLEHGTGISPSGSRELRLFDPTSSRPL